MTINGNAIDPQKAQLEQLVSDNYMRFAQQLAAINLLMSTLPLEALLGANQRQQRASILTAPAGVTAEQLAQHATALRNDEKIIAAALNLQRMVAATNPAGE